MNPPLELPSRGQVLADWRSRGGGVAAVLPVHAPRALLRAFDLLPVEVWGPPSTPTASGEAHLQAYTCSIVRSTLSHLMGGGLDQADLLLVPNACDSLQGLGSLLLDFPRSTHPVLTFHPPRGDPAGALDFLARELARLYERLAELTGRRPDGEALRAAVALDEQADATLGRLLDARARLPLGDLEFYRLARSREYLPAEEFVARAGGVLGQAGGRRGGIPLVVSGIVPEPMALLGALSEAGAFVAADDFAAVGRRRYPPGTRDDPFERMAERLLGGPPDSTRVSGVDARVDHLTRLVEASSARAVVFWGIKFCEPELFYLPLLRRALEASGIPSVALELDVDPKLPDAAVTRLEALVESVS